jgi:starch synthase (maltosyl-transferring)
VPPPPATPKFDARGGSPSDGGGVKSMPPGRADGRSPSGPLVVGRNPPQFGQLVTPLGIDIAQKGHVFEFMSAMVQAFYQRRAREARFASLRRREGRAPSAAPEHTMRDRHATPPLIYNLFPRLVGAITGWEDHLARAAEMGFTWVYLNPPFYPGFSGSIYAVKDYGRLDPIVSPPGMVHAGLEELTPVLARARALGLRAMVDLVINHTSKDSDLVKNHPEWYCRDEKGDVQSPFAIDPADARKPTVWGDLAEIDHRGAGDAEGLAAFVEGVVEDCLEVGFDGFRCDAAYKVPATTWRSLTKLARRVKPDALFVAETLGCRIEEMMALKGAGFDYVMNSSKYWGFDAPWAIEQHAGWQKIAPSISFSESHDTPRLAAECDGDERVVRQRFVLAAVFSAGLMMPVGFELGFKTKLDVVTTRPTDWEPPSLDLRRFVAGTLAMKLRRPALAGEGQLAALSKYDEPTFVFLKKTKGDRALIVANKDTAKPREVELAPHLKKLSKGAERGLVRPCLDAFEPAPLAAGAPLRLEPAEIAIVV